MIAIIDYGGGNIGSVKNALDFIGVESIITNNLDIIKASDKIILPGQGRFGDVMKKLRIKKLDSVIVEEIKNMKPYFGICIGLQILFEKGEEDPDVPGLGIFKGTVPRLKTDFKVPQIGWNNVKQKIQSKFEIGNEFFYFVHSYYVKPIDETLVLATANYGIDFACAIQKKNILATQFHPEKSGKAGLKLLKRWCIC